MILGFFQKGYIRIYIYICRPIPSDGYISHLSQERFKVAMLSAHRTGELHKVAEKLATEVAPGFTQFPRIFFLGGR